MDRLEALTETIKRLSVVEEKICLDEIPINGNIRLPYAKTGLSLELESPEDYPCGWCERPSIGGFSDGTNYKDCNTCEFKDSKPPGNESFPEFGTIEIICNSELIIRII